jgi:voltage-gated potassium channel
MPLTPTIANIVGKRLIVAVSMIFVVLLIGTLGFHFLEGWPLLESAYVATQTVTTVGYGDIPPITHSGRIFSIAFMLLGVGTVLYGLTLLAQAVVQSGVIEALSSRRKIREMDKLEGHYIVCGAGRVGRRIIRTLRRQSQPFVIIERDEKRLAEFESANLYTLIGDATLEENLLQAGVKRARGLATCLPDDADNVYVVLTARGLSPELHIVARAVEEQAEPKLIRAGASRVVAPTIIGSQSMARALLKPAIADFMESIVAESLDLVFEEVAIDGKHGYAGKALRDTNIMSELNLIVVAIRRGSGEFRFNPNGDTVIEEGDLLIVIGNADAVKQLLEANS